jgi:hypothetical protein
VSVSTRCWLSRFARPAESDMITNSDADIPFHPRLNQCSQSPRNTSWQSMMNFFATIPYTAFTVLTPCNLIIRKLTRNYLGIFLKAGWLARIALTDVNKRKILPRSGRGSVSGPNSG